MKRLIYNGCSVLTGVIVLILAHNTDGFSEWYAVHIFPAFPDTVGRIMSPIPFSVFEALICGTALFILAYVVYLLRMLILWRLRDGLKKALIKASLTLLTVACTLFMISTLTCTVHYGRDSFAELTGRQVTESSKEDLLALCELLINDINELSETALEEGYELFAAGGPDMKSEAREAMRRIGSETPLLDGFYPNPKPVFFSKLMSRLGLTGIYSPFTIEANSLSSASVVIV